MTVIYSVDRIAINCKTSPHNKLVSLVKNRPQATTLESWSMTSPSRLQKWCMKLAHKSYSNTILCQATTELFWMTKGSQTKPFFPEWQQVTRSATSLIWTGTEFTWTCAFQKIAFCTAVTSVALKLGSDINPGLFSFCYKANIIQIKSLVGWTMPSLWIWGQELLYCFLRIDLINLLSHQDRLVTTFVW